MSKMEFTQAQKQAILSKEKNILVSAGAGSGKTAVLTERIVSLFAKGECDADEIAVITFTNAAAAEMKQRIRKKTLEYIKTNEPTTDCGILLDTKARENLKRQRSLIESSRICTIHALCMNIIKNNYFASMCDPAVRTISEAQKEMFFKRALDETFEEAYIQEDSQFYDFCDAYGKINDDSAIKELVKNLYTASRTCTHPNDFLNDSIENYSVSSIEEFESSQIVSTAKGIIIAGIEKMLALLNKAKEYADVYDKTKENSIYLDDEISALGAYLLNSTNTFRDALEALGSLKMGVYRKKTDFHHGDELRAYIMQAKAILGSPSSQGLKNTFAFTYLQYYRHTVLTSSYIKTAVLLTQEVARRYSELKEKHFYIDFSDMEYICYDILSNESALKEVQGEFKFVFVDEYQDVSSLQEEIITKIAVNNLFSVGDIKQSIYGFRQAAPQLFLSRAQLYTNHPECGEMIYMNENFRSQKKIIDSVNSVFSKIMTSNNTDIDYEATEKLISKSSLGNIEGLPTLYVLNGENSKNDDSLNVNTSFVARLVQRLLNETIYDEATGEKRLITPDDIAVISRNMNRVRDDYENAIKSLGIPVASGEKTSFYDLSEISLVTDLICVVDNAKNDIPLLSVMRSFIYAFSENELMEIRNFANEKLFFNECVFEYAQNGDNDALQGKINAMLSQIYDFRKYALNHPIDALLRYIYNSTSLFSRFGALADGKIRQQNLLHLKDVACQYESGTLKGLYNFILYIQQARLSKNIRQSAYISQGVNLITVHKSKGLEFAVVIITDCEKKFSSKDTQNDVLCEPTVGFTLRYREKNGLYKCDTLGRSVAKVLINQQRYNEEMRILYVAATRAKQKLYFVGESSKVCLEDFSDCIEGKKQESSFMDMLIRAVYPPEGFTNVVFTDENKEFGDKDGKANHILELPITETSDDEKHDYYKDIADALSYSYPNKQLVLLPTKLSVSAIKQTFGDDETLEYASRTLAMTTSPLFMQNSDMNDALLRGTFTHALLEKTDKKTAREDINKALIKAKDELLHLYIGTEEKAYLADMTAAENFLLSHIGQKFLNSDKDYRELQFIMNKKASDINDIFKDTNETVLIQGVMDLVFTIGEKLYLVDYKTDKIYNEEYKNKLIEKYSHQISLYNEALKGIFGKYADEAYICFITQNSYVKI